MLKLIDFSFTEEQDLFRMAVREWADKSLNLEQVRKNDENEEIPKNIIREMGELVLTGLQQQ